MVALEEARFLDVKTPLEVLGEDGKKTTYSYINDAARSLGIEVMEVYTMISNGKARILDGETVKRGTLMERRRRRGKRVSNAKRKVEIPNGDGTINVFGSIKEATRALGKRDSTSVYVMVANGKARFVHEEEEEEEEKFYDALEYQEWEKEEEKFHDALEHQDWEKKGGRKEGMEWNDTEE